MTSLKAQGPVEIPEVRLIAHDESPLARLQDIFKLWALWWPIHKAFIPAPWTEHEPIVIEYKEEERMEGD